MAVENPNNDVITLDDVLNERKQIAGQIAVAMAHNINNPIAYILSGIITLGQYIEEIAGSKDTPREESQKDITSEEVKYLIKDSKDCLGEMRDGARSIKNTVRLLSLFAGAGSGSIPDGLGESIDCTLSLFYFSSDLPIEKKYSEGLSDLKIDYAEINHALYNIFRCIDNYEIEMKSSQKLDGEGKKIRNRMEISTERTEEGVISINMRYFTPYAQEIADTGCSSRDGKREKTLGLLIAKHILKNNGGDLYIYSDKEKTEFRLEFREK